MICPAEHELARALSVGADDALTAHFAECARCRDAWNGFERAIRLARELPAEIPSSAHREEARTALLASADPGTPRRVHRVSRLVWVAAGIAAAATVALWLSRGTADELHSHASLHPSMGASFAVASGAPDEIVRLHDGVLAIDVDALGSEDRFRVVVGDDEVEVRGTSFEVTAHDDKLVAVRVAHGRVDVRPRVGVPASVGAGESWHGERTASVEPPASSGSQTASSDSPTASSDSQRASSGAQTTSRDAATTSRDKTTTHRVTTSHNAATPDATMPTRTMPTVTDRRDIAKPISAEETAYNDAWDALRASDFRKAAAGFARVVALSPAGPLADDAAYWRAVSLARAARGTEAITAFRELLDEYPSSPRTGEASAMLGWLLVDANELVEAERRFRAAANDASESVRASARSGLDALAAKRTK